MSHKSVQRGNRRYAVPGTIKQTGNTAPRFQWPPAIRVLIHCIAHHLDFTDDQMARLREFPDTETLGAIFTKTVPWFSNLYDETQRAAAEAKGYPLDKLQPFSAAKLHNRLLYMFTEPKDAKGARRYGISVEHPDNPQGNRRAVNVKCSVEIHRRLKLGLTISREEIERWGEC